MRGQISVQLTWIFALIAGLTILVFLIMFSRNQVENSDSTTSIVVLQNIKAELTVISKTPNTFNRIRTPRIKLNVMCEDSATSGIMLEGGASLEETRYMPLFSSDVLEGTEILAYTKEWALPENVDRFVYLATPKTLFVLVNNTNDDSKVKWFDDLLPKDYDREILPQGEDPKGTYEEYRFVYFNADPGHISGVHRRTTFQIPPDRKMSAVNIMDKTVKFYDMLENRFEEEGDPVSTMGNDALVLGAAFSDMAAYECNMQKALFRLRLVTMLNMNRTLTVMEELTEGVSECMFYLNPTGAYPAPTFGLCDECLSLMRDLPFNYKEMMSELIDDYEDMNLEKLADHAENIYAIEGDLAKASCPTL